jgi:hypothetical protein
MNNWSAFSNVEITLSDFDDECTMHLKQTNVPSDVDIGFLKNGWNTQIIKPINLLCGYPILSQD